MPKSSVIVPVYNVKEFLEKCVDSILNQTERDFELLLIDDGSTDGSGALCDELAGKDDRIRVIHQENRGLGGARNTGIEAAVGEWLLFLDSDDWIEPETLETTLTAGEQQEADMVLFGFRSVNMQGKELGIFLDDLPRNQGLSMKTHKELLLCFPSAANKLYKRKLFCDTGIRYPLRVWYEDMRTTLKVMLPAKRIVSLDYVGYNYLQRPGSIIQDTKNVNRNSEILDAFEDLFSYFREQGLWEQYEDELCFLTLNHLYLAASVRVIRLDPKNPLIPRFAEYFKKHFPLYRSNKYWGTLSGRQKLLLNLLERKLYFVIALLFKIKG